LESIPLFSPGTFSLIPPSFFAAFLIIDGRIWTASERHYLLWSFGLKPLLQIKMTAQAWSQKRIWKMKNQKLSLNIICMFLFIGKKILSNISWFFWFSLMKRW
jgi:hypothetical protein